MISISLNVTKVITCSRFLTAKNALFESIRNFFSGIITSIINPSRNVALKTGSNINLKKEESSFKEFTIIVPDLKSKFSAENISVLGHQAKLIKDLKKEISEKNAVIEGLKEQVSNKKLD